MSDKPEDLLIWQYRGKPKARQTVGLFFRESKEAWRSAQAVGEMLNIDTATGYALDLVGRHVGLSRTLRAFVPKEYFGWAGIEAALGFGAGTFYREGEPLKESSRLDDDDYRFLLRARMLKNTQRPTLEGIDASIKQLLGDSAFVIDSYDMTMNIVVPEMQLNSLRLHAVLNLDILVRPVGVWFKLIVISSDHPFGWANVSQTFGFNEGKFTRLINADNQEA
ncbi:DUF2612 domain-containing protein [Yersinia pestis subsp. pestis]|uniref:Phage-related protein n=7 Tax=Yersinia pestis TaxID=632 RepID=A0A0K1H0L2_YERPE|nr:DUF2612 domain-containing protein [Yersinia pestis]AKT73175.1 Phage-related protein [Yersinia pestis]MBE7778967.1 DUF2612 domain-containing protein [Yersinia pestis]MBE7783807.1 DUF2612 domain-containing protein [Yersinia pestis]MBE7787278.1 DUF2612 domain-containing protein [Yersinia pestis]MBE7803595.1 DUF2612 domain-containing protein [Yersinia pestis]